MSSSVGVPAAVPAVIYYLAMADRLLADRVDEYVRDVYPTGE